MQCKGREIGVTSTDAAFARAFFRGRRGWEAGILLKEGIALIAMSSRFHTYEVYYTRRLPAVGGNNRYQCTYPRVRPY